MDDSASSVNTSSVSSIPQSSRGGLFSFLQRSNPTPSTQNYSNRAILERRSKNQVDIKRILATAKAIADDDSHPNQDEVLDRFDSLILNYLIGF